MNSLLLILVVAHYRRCHFKNITKLHINKSTKTDGKIYSTYNTSVQQDLEVLL